MDGPPLRRITFRVEHDCPVAELSRAHPRLDIEVWSGHRVEVVTARQAGLGSDAVQDALVPFLKPEHTFPFRDGTMAVWRPRVRPKASISRRLESHGVVWLQPWTVRGGWEQVDAIAFSPEAEQAALDELRAENRVQVLARQDVGPDDVAGSLFLSLQPALDAPTDKQAEAVLAAFEAGYYRSPRKVRTADVAASLGIGRSAFEERLRGGENKVMAEVAPALRRRHSQKASRP